MSPDIKATSPALFVCSSREKGHLPSPGSLTDGIQPQKFSPSECTRPTVTTATQTTKQTSFSGWQRRNTWTTLKFASWRRGFIEHRKYVLRQQEGTVYYSELGTSYTHLGEREMKRIFSFRIARRSLCFSFYYMVHGWRPTVRASPPPSCIIVPIICFFFHTFERLLNVVVAFTCTCSTLRKHQINAIQCSVVCCNTELRANSFINNCIMIQERLVGYC